MSKKEEFRNFINNNPNIASYVIDKKYTWQDLYEMYDMYGDNNSIWDKFKEEKKLSFSSIISTLKGINSENFTNNIDNIQKAISFLEDLTSPSKKEDKKEIKKSKYEDIDRFYSD